MHVQLLCGKSSMEIVLPDTAVTIRMEPIPPLSDPEGAIDAALNAPIGSKPLAEIARGRKDACVVISDITRPVPNEVILPPMLRVLEQAGIPREKITILISTGMHRPNLGEELKSMVGQWIMDNYRVVNHYCQDAGTFREIARIGGAPIEICNTYLDADLKILTGLIEPHFYAGFSGGRKSVLPGISSLETLKFMHSYGLIAQLEGVNCRLENNLFHDYAVRITELAGADFILNVVINRGRELAGVFAGHFDLAHREGCELVAGHALTWLEEPVDMVVTSAGGHPLDATFYQVSKALTCARDVLRPGGAVVVACGCQEGLGSREFRGIMCTMPTPEAFDRHFRKPENFVIDQWCAQNIYQALAHAGSVHVCSPGLTAEEVAAFGAVKIHDMQAAVDALLPGHPRVAVFPEGPYSVGKVRA
jgi:lactate racemase